MEDEYYDEPPMPIRRRRRYRPEESSNRLLWAFCIALCGFVLYLLFWQPAPTAPVTSTPASSATPAPASSATPVPNPLTASNPNIPPLIVEPTATTFKVPNDRIFSKIFSTVESDLKRCETKYGTGNCEIVGKNPFRKAVYKCSNQAADAKLLNVMDWVLKIEDGASRNMTCELPSK